MKRVAIQFSLLILLGAGELVGVRVCADEPLRDDLQSAMARAADNREQIQAALQQVPETEREGMEFLVRHMPDRDLKELTAEYLLENVAYAYRAWNEAPWKASLPKEVFLNDVLPYASINERRDRWREDFYTRFRPLTADSPSPAKAAALLNQKIFSLLNVRYSRRRPKADQSPYESIEAGLASCTGLSVLLIDACRAVAVPARFVGTPMWSDRSGNHSWVEVWDQGWHFTGAAEPSGDELDRAWFVGRAAKAQIDHPRHAIYAVSFRRTPLHFPFGWNRSVDYVYALNVTQRYLGQGEPTPEGHVQVMFQVLDGPGGERCAASLKIRDAAGQVVQGGTTKDERFDGNDHLVINLPINQTFQAEANHEQRSASAKITTDSDGKTITLELKPAEANRKATDDSGNAVESLRAFLKTPNNQRKELCQHPFADVPLTEKDAKRAADLLWQDHVRRIQQTRAKEIADQRLVLDGLTMPFSYQVYGDKPDEGRSLFISMHGGGGAPKRVNDRQWENQKRLYQPEEGVYLSPRAPTDTWNLWHQPHIDRLFDRLIEDLIVLEDVNPNRVYIMGYSAGGDGVYQLAPRMADRLAAAAMMAGHPNDASPLGLRNLPFTIHVGGNDKAYNRNQVAQQWADQLANLREREPEGYFHWVKIYEGKGHWLGGEDAAAIPWMAKYQRNPRPTSIVWKQDDVTGRRFYWLAVHNGQAKPRAEVRATIGQQQLKIQTSDVSQLLVRFDDQLVKLDRPLEIVVNGQQVFRDIVPRTIDVLARTLAERGDPDSMFSGEVAVTCPNDAVGGS